MTGSERSISEQTLVMAAEQKAIGKIPAVNAEGAVERGSSASEHNARHNTRVICTAATSTRERSRAAYHPPLTSRCLIGCSGRRSNLFIPEADSYKVRADLEAEQKAREDAQMKEHEANIAKACCDSFASAKEIPIWRTRASCFPRAVPLLVWVRSH